MRKFNETLVIIDTSNQQYLSLSRLFVVDSNDCKMNLIYSKLEQANLTDFELQSLTMCLDILFNSISFSNICISHWFNILNLLGIRGSDQVWCLHRPNQSNSHKKDADVPRSHLTSHCRLSCVCCRQGSRERERGEGCVCLGLIDWPVDTLQFVYILPTIQTELSV